MTRAGRSRGLAEDARGAIMVLGLVFAVFLTAALYHVVGIAEAIAQRESMQDAADAGAFSAAVLHARGMNVIALVNMIMAALLAVLVALKLLEAVLAVAIVLLAAAAFFTGGTSASAIPGVETLRERVRTVHDGLRPEIHTALETLHATARGVRAIVPWMAQVRVLQVIREHGPYARGGFALPSRAALPTIDASFSSLCAEAGDYVGRTAELAIPDLPGGVDEDVGDAIGELAKARADWFCGAKGGMPPKTKIKEKRALPVLAARAACEADGPGTRGYDAKKHEDACKAAVRSERRSAPDSRTGECTTDECEERAERARTECKPRSGARLFNWMYQERKVRRKWGFRRGRRTGEWTKITDEPVGDPVLVAPDPESQRPTPPCGRYDASVAPGWNEDIHPEDKPDEILPVCTEEPSFPVVVGDTGYYEQEITEITQVYGCLEVRAKVIDVGKVTEGDRLEPPTDGKSKSPQVASDPDLGGEGYQLRAVALGSLPRAAPEAVVRVAAWGRKTPGVLRGAVDKFGRFSFAQAEYYYAVEQPQEPDPSRWLWNMRWTARLRRFRLPEAGAGDAGSDANRGVDADDAAKWGLDSAPRDLAGACDRFTSGDASAKNQDGLPGCGSIADDLGIAEDAILH